MLLHFPCAADVTAGVQVAICDLQEGISVPKMSEKGIPNNIMELPFLLLGMLTTRPLVPESNLTFVSATRAQPL